MNCFKCNSELKEGDKFCQSCGTKNDFSNSNNAILETDKNDEKTLKIIKKMNILSSIIYLGGTIALYGFYAYLLFFTEDFGIFVAFFSLYYFFGIFYIFNVGIRNLKNIKKIYLPELKVGNGLELGYTAFHAFIILFATIIAFELEALLYLLIIILLLIIPLIKLKLLKKINRNEREKESYKKANIILAIVIFIPLIITLLTPLNSCNKIYELDYEELNRELGKYEIVSSKEIGYDATGEMSCRSKDTQTILSFYDKYNNYIEVEALDSNRGGIRKDLTLNSIEEIQLVNNVLNNTLIKVEYDEEIPWNNDLVLDDKYLNTIFKSNIYISNTDENTDIPLYIYDIKNTDYQLNFSISQKDEVLIDINEIEPYLNNYVLELYNILGTEHIEEINVGIDKEYYTVKYENGMIIWED